MNVLLVGAAGTVGIAVHKDLATHGHRVRCVDIAPPCHDMTLALELFGYDPTLPDSEWLYQDATNPGAAEAMLEGMDAVVYAALTTVYEATPQFTVNVAGPFCLLKACAARHVSKFVYASTVSVNGPRPNETVTEQTPPHVGASYDTSKWLAEQLLREFTHKHGVKTLALRLGTVCPHLRIRNLEGDYRQSQVDVRDVARAFRMALEDRRISHDVLHVVSQGTPVYCDPTHAKEALGFEAEFNGPGHFEELHRKQLAYLNSIGAPK